MTIDMKYSEWTSGDTVRVVVIIVVVLFFMLGPRCDVREAEAQEVEDAVQR